jgi:ferritin
LNRLLPRPFSSDCNIPEDKIEKKFHFPAVIERQINEQIGHELYASHICLSIAQYFYNTEVCLSGFGDYFRQLSNEERQHALWLTDYQNKRGGCVQLCGIAEPPKCEYQTLCDPFMCMLEIEHGVTERLFKLIECAFKQQDYATALFISDKFADEQVSWNHGALDRHQ